MHSNSAQRTLRKGNLAGKMSLTVPPGSLSLPVTTWHLYASEIIFPICIWAKCHHSRWTWVYVTGKLCIYIKYANYEHESFLGTSKHLSALSFCVCCSDHMSSQQEGLVKDEERSTREFHESCFIGHIYLPRSKRNIQVLWMYLLWFQDSTFHFFSGNNAKFWDITGKLKFGLILKTVFVWYASGI